VLNIKQFKCIIIIYFIKKIILPDDKKYYYESNATGMDQKGVKMDYI
jgi:hypothetical protein